ncbi:MAG TPA: helix-hairpin-helix domain-containing protein [Ktedonobacterales bacterium]|jgi:DNA polymerase (family 10)
MFQFTQSVALVPDPGDAAENAPPVRVTNPQIAEVLFNIATLLEMQQANPYRIAAYRNAARGLLVLPDLATEIIRRGEMLSVPGLGQRLRRKITELVTTGRMTFYDDLCEESLPDDVRDLMRVHTVGPRTALRLVGQLGIHSVPELLVAAGSGRLRQHYGFGPRREARIAAQCRVTLSSTPPAPPPATGSPALAASSASGHDVTHVAAAPAA